MFLKQGDGRTVLQPDGKSWPDEGMEAPDTLYIRRRIRDLDLVEAAPPVAEAAGDPPASEAPLIDTPAGNLGKKPKGE